MPLKARLQYRLKMGYLHLRAATYGSHYGNRVTREGRAFTREQGVVGQAANQPVSHTFDRR